VGDPQVEVQENVLDSYSDRLSELTVRLNGLARVTPCGLGVKRSTVVGDPRLEFQQNILDSHSDRLSELTVRLNGLAGDRGAWGLSTQLWWGRPQVGIPTAASGKCFRPGNVLI